MREEDIVCLEEPVLTPSERLYLPQIVAGLKTTLRHMFSLKKRLDTCVQYPEQKRELRVANYRGVHRLNKDPDGRVACVACFMCSTACPANCIHIEAGESPWPDREKYPVKFDIDELRCIYCGMCEEACPCDAIELTPHYELVGQTRDEMIFDKQKLLQVFDRTVDVKPRKNPPVTDYGLTGGQSRDVASPNAERKI
ncbi:NADH-quinone oxidoreductase subunit I [Phycisphaerae bacterium RAS1]|nr:NADH-quinone oxidoreductase subunit I [Phycisphaerae bacterium RAS1]